MLNPARSTRNHRPLLQVAAWPLAVACALYHGASSANPSGADVVAGQVAISQTSPSTLQVEQATHSAIVNWQQFSVGSGEQVRFDQPSASAAILNRVVGSDPSQILGNLSANGRVFLVNPQGVMFGTGSRVDVGSLVASTLDIQDQDFLDGRYVMAGAAGSSTAVVNRGQIQASDGGYVVLAGAQVRNEGLIEARGGDVALLSGSAATVTLDAEGLVGYAVDAAALDAGAGIVNAGVILADGGRAVLSASTARELARQAVNNSGRVQAHSISEQDGTIVLEAAGGSIVHSGVLDVSGEAGASGGRLRLDTDIDIDLADGSSILASGDGAQARGGELQMLAQRDLRFAPTARVQARGAAGGGRVSMSGLRQLQAHGRFDLGAGGSVTLDPGEFIIGNGSAADGSCNANLCEVELENVLSGGSSYSVISATGILVEDLADDAIDGRSTLSPGSGGALLLGVGSGRDAASYVRGDDGSISFTDRGDAIRLDGGFEATAGSFVGIIDIGHVLSRESIVLDAADGVSTGNLSHAAGGFDPYITAYSAYGGISTGSINAYRAVFLDGAGDVTVNGDVLITGSIAFADPQSGLVVGAAFDASSDFGSVEVYGSVSVNGEVSRFDGLSNFAVFGAYIDLRTGAGAGNIYIAGPVTLNGLIGTVTGVDDWLALAAQLRLGSAGGAVTLDGGLTLNGRLDSVLGGSGIFGRGSEAVLGIAGTETLLGTLQVTVAGPIVINGQVGDFSVLDNSEAIGGFLQTRSESGGTQLLGPVSVSGSVATASGVDGLIVRGAYAELLGNGGDVQTGSTLAVNGSVGFAAGNDNLQVNGASLFIDEVTGAVTLGGNVNVGGSIGEAYGNAFAEVRGAELDVRSFSDTAPGGNIVALGNVVAGGNAGHVEAGNDSFTNGVFLRLSAGDSAGVFVTGDVSATGDLTFTAAGDAMFANAAEINLAGLDVVIDGNLLLDGSSGSVSGGDGAFIVSSYLDLRARAGNAVVGGAVDVRGTLDSVRAGFGSQAQAVFIGASAPGLLQFGSIFADGRSGNALLGESSFSNGVFIDLQAGSVNVLGALEAHGRLDATTAGQFLSAEATDVFIRGGSIALDGNVLLSGMTGDIVTGDSSSVSGTLFDASASGDLTLGGLLSVDGGLQSVAGDPFGFAPATLFARATSVVLNSDGGTLSVDGDILLNGTTGTVDAGSNSFSNGVFLGLFAQFGNVLLHGDVNASGRLNAMSGGDFLFAEASEMRVVGQAIAIDGSVILDGTTGEVSGGFQSFVAGSALYFYSDGDISIGGGVSADGMLGSVRTFAASHAQAVALTMDADFGSIDITGDLRAEGHTGTSELLGDSNFSNGAFLDLSANIVYLRADLQVTGSLGTTTSGDFLSAEAADALITALLIDIGGSVLLDGTTGSVTTGQGSYVAGNFLDFSSSFGTTIGGNLIANGMLAAVSGSDPDLPSDFLFARATSVDISADSSGAVTILGNVTLNGTTGSVEAGSSSFSNGVFLSLVGQDFNSTDAGDVVIGGTLTANGSLGTTTAGEGLFARATEIFIQSYVGTIELRGGVILNGSNDTVRSGINSFVSANSITLDSFLGDTLLGGGLSASGTLGDVQGFSGLFARATELTVTTTAGSFQASGNVTLVGTTGTVEAGNGSFANAVSVNLSTDGGSIVMLGDFTATGSLGNVLGASASDLFASAAELDAYAIGGELRIDGDLTLVGNTGTVSASNGAFVSGSFLRLATLFGDVTLGGALTATGELDTIAAEDFSSARAVALSVFADQGNVRIGGNVTANGHTGTASLGLQSFSNGAFLSLAGDEVRLQGNLSLVGTLDATTAGDELFAEAATMFVEAGRYLFDDASNIIGVNGGTLAIDGSVSLTGSTGSIQAGNDSFIAGSFLELSSLNQNLAIGGSLGASGTLASVDAGSGLFARAAELRIHSGSTTFDADFNEILLGSGNVNVGGDIALTGNTGSIASGEFSFIAGSFLDLSTVNGDILVGGSLSATGTLGSVGGSDDLLAQAAELRVRSGSSTFNFDPDSGEFSEAALGSGDITVMGNISLDGTTGSVSGGSGAFMTGSVLDLVANGGNISVGGQLRALGSLGLGESDTISGGDFSFARAVALTVAAADGVLMIGSDVTADGHTGTARLGSDSFSNGVSLSLSADSMQLQGNLSATGSLAATTAGNALFAEAATMTVQAGDYLYDAGFNVIGVSGGNLTVGGSISLNGSTGSITAGDDSFVAGSFLDVSVLDGDLAVGGSLGASGTLASVDAGSGLFARAAELRIHSGSTTFDADFNEILLGSGNVNVGGNISLTGNTGSIASGEFSFIAGSFLDLSTVNGDILVGGSLSATGTLGSVGGSDDLLAQAAELRVRSGSSTFNFDPDSGEFSEAALGSGDITVMGDISLDGTTGSVSGGSGAFMTGSVLDLVANGGNISVGGQLRALGSLGLGESDTISGGDFSFARAVALTVAAADGVLMIGSDVTADGHTGTARLGSDSFSNGVSLSLSADSMQLQGNLSATGSLAATTAGNALFAEAATMTVQAGDYLYDAGFNVIGVSGGNLTVGGSISLQGSTGSITAGDDSFVAGSFLDVSVLNGDLAVGGSLGATGTLASVDAGSGLFARAAELRIHSGSTTFDADFNEILLGSGNVTIGGDVLLSGTTGTVTGGASSFMSGSVLDLVADGGNIGIGGRIDALGSLGLGESDTISGGDFSSAQAVAVTVTAEGSAISIGGDVSAEGNAGAATLGSDSFSNGVFLQLQARQISITGNLAASGQLDATVAGDRLFARATELQVATQDGAFSLGGSLRASGRTGDVTGLSGIFVNGAFVALTNANGGSGIGGDLLIDGQLGSVQGGDGAAASGAEFQALTDGVFSVAGGLQVSGALSSFSAGNDSGAFGADVFVFSGSAGLAGDTFVGGPVSVSGDLGSVLGSNNLYSYGAFASFASEQGHVRLNGPISIQGTLGTVIAGDTIDVSGVGFWADATRGDVRLAGPLTVTGTVESVQSGNGAFINGAFAYLTADDGALGVAGDLTVSGTLASVQGGSSIAASGADLLIERAGTRADSGADLSIGGNISETGSIGSFVVADTTSSSRFSGGVLMNANDGSLFFRDISADNAFIYFNQDSALETSQLLAREYLEIVTPSSLPTLIGPALSITAPEVFLSANMDFDLLTIHGETSLVVSAANIHGDTLRLTGNGLIQLADGASTDVAQARADSPTTLSGDSVFISGGRVLSDTGTLIDAGGLDVIATDTIRLAGSVRIGTGLAQDPGDTALLDLIAAQSPDLLPTSSGPNAFFQAPTVALADLAMAGDYLHIESNTTQLGTVSLQPGTLVHLDPLVDLPFFAESVDVTGAGLDSVKDRLNTEDNRVIPNLGPFNAAQGDQALSGRPVLNEDRTDQPGDPQFTVGGGVPTLSDLILDSGLAGSTIVIGASDYTAGIQIADQLVVNVLPSSTNFIFATTSLVLLTQPIQTNGQVFVVGGGAVETDRDVFYKLLVEQITAYFAALENPDEYDGEVEEKTRNEEDCEE